jgi:hypothetical protein
MKKLAFLVFLSGIINGLPAQLSLKPTGGFGQ